MLQKFGEVVELDIDYEELAMDIYGRYHYDAGSDTLTDQFVPERHAPNYPEFKTPDEEDEFYSSDAHHNLWEDALQRDGVTVVIDEKTCLEQERERKAAGFSI
jgi:predicted kinase